MTCPLCPAADGSSPPCPHQSCDYGVLFRHLPSAFALHEVVYEGDRIVDYVFREVNLAFERMTGRSRQEVIGKRVTEVIPGIGRRRAG